MSARRKQSRELDPVFRNPLLDEELELNLDVFRNIDPEQLTTWSQVEMWCALNGTEVTDDMFKFLLIGMNLYTNIYEMFMAEIAKAGFLDELVNRLETMEYIYKLTSDDFFSWKVVDDWLRMFGNIQNDYIPLDIADKKNSLVRKFKLFSVIDKRYPLLLVKFYDKHKKVLHQHDSEFIRFLMARTKVKAEHNEVFKQIYILMQKEQRQWQKTTMFLN